MDITVINITRPYDQSLLRFRGIASKEMGSLYRPEGFRDFNRLLDINKVFSARPGHHPIDRTNTVKAPWKFSVPRSWTMPNRQYSLDDALEIRVSRLCDIGHTINLLWSGGIDSTVMVNAFLKYAPFHDRLRLCYTYDSIHEHPEYLDFLSKFPNLPTALLNDENWDDSLDDGLVVSGDSGDETHASLDASFFYTHGIDTLHRPWKDFFYEQIPDDEFISWAENYFSLSGRDIDSVLEARWFFYTACKLHSILFGKTAIAMDNGRGWHPNKFVGFYDCDEYESWIYHNTDLLITGREYRTYKQSLKDWCCKFDGIKSWAIHKEKTDSGSLFQDLVRRRLLQHRYSVMLMSDGTFLRTPNLPWFSKIEWHNQYGGSYDFLDNEPD